MKDQKKDDLPSLQKMPSQDKNKAQTCVPSRVVSTFDLHEILHCAHSFAALVSEEKPRNRQQDYHQCGHDDGGECDRTAEAQHCNDIAKDRRS
jgi:hypothetical protein